MKDMVVFHGLKKETLNFISTLLEEKIYNEGDIICNEGDRANEMYFIENGSVDIVVQGKIIGQLKNGDTFGEMSLIDMMKRSATVKAREKTIALELSTRNFIKLYRRDLEEYTIIIMNIARELSRRLRKMDNEILNFKENI